MPSMHLACVDSEVTKVSTTRWNGKVTYNKKFGSHSQNSELSIMPQANDLLSTSPIHHYFEIAKDQSIVQPNL